MGRRLVTIATFDQPAQARLAQSALEDAGIQAAVADESIVAMDWLLSNAVGGIKVQVWEEDADRAVGVLEEALGPGGEVDPAELTAEAAAAPPEDREPPAAGPAPDGPAAPPPDSRDRYARRLFLTAWLGLGCPPLGFYGLYLFLNAAFGAGPLSPRGRFELLVGGAVLAPSLFLGFGFLWLIGKP